MTELAPKSIVYCGICSWPPEYCEFGVSRARCQSWLDTNHHDLYEKIYTEDITNQTSTLSLEKQEKLNNDLAKAQHKQELKQERELQKMLNSKIVIKRIERNKRKHIISISGLEVFNLDSKKLAKTFASKFATGASVTKNADKTEEILIQGDVSDEAKEYIEKLLQDQGLNDIKVEQIDDKKKKKKDAAAAAAATTAGST
ncbi:translation machinery-associated protein 22 [Spathaspora passalidarum NRRL Y-27907]|uniref:Translation machinery-associated protein 22 n=1 Tax=Spathaspora passalidarum (strain NRRL Y-27907 / 11-Y1) TaxID=619300 RepID=G3ASN4_SPAPN|nr:translation machinery-associated protein 22 [Spathaspora passalidarum NRRL Y-27907]EGW30720.1 translation machinery-associated protein 22 [Spathaspora passalidarum NRRL Y-27907]